MKNYQVIVSNLGTVHTGNNENAARKEFNEYVKISKDGKGRAAFEDVTLFCDGEIIKEYCPIKWSAEYTDTFNGEANYSWVKRANGTALTEKSAIRAARKALNLDGIKGRVENNGDSYTFYPFGSCTVLFINFCGE